MATPRNSSGALIVTDFPATISRKNEGGHLSCRTAGGRPRVVGPAPRREERGEDNPPEPLAALVHPPSRQIVAAVERRARAGDNYAGGKHGQPVLAMEVRDPLLRHHRDEPGHDNEENDASASGYEKATSDFTEHFLFLLVCV